MDLRVNKVNKFCFGDIWNSKQSKHNFFFCLPFCLPLKRDNTNA